MALAADDTMGVMAFTWLVTLDRDIRMGILLST
jgi:hypothetical protein